MSYRLADFGSYCVGGRLHRVTEGTPRSINFTRDIDYLYDPRGSFAVEHAYVQYFVPEDRRQAPPVLLVHGGGMHGSTWETTPDGRPGWLHLLLDAGYEVHVLDNVERGRSGFAPGLWPGQPILRSLEEAWTLFRIGPPEGFQARQAFPGQAFPVEALEALGRSFVPRWLSTSGLQTEALLSVLARLEAQVGPALVICHSQGGETVFDAAERRPDLLRGILAVEPSAAPRDPKALRGLPIAILVGDHLEIDDRTRFRKALWVDTVQDLNSAGGRAALVDTAARVRPGGSHLLMMDRHNADCLAAGLEALSTL